MIRSAQLSANDSAEIVFKHLEPVSVSPLASGAVHRLGNALQIKGELRNILQALPSFTRLHIYLQMRCLRVSLEHEFSFVHALISHKNMDKWNLQNIFGCLYPDLPSKFMICYSIFCPNWYRNIIIVIMMIYLDYLPL